MEIGNIGLLWDSFNWFVALGVMMGYLIVDGLYAKYTLEVVRLKPYMSASIGAMMHFILAFGVISYTGNWLYVFPLAVGSWIGTYLVVKFEKNKAELALRSVKEV